VKNTVWTFGLIAGAILSVMMWATLPFMDRIGFDRAEVIGYTTIVAAFLLIFFGVRSYRENTAGGALSFGRALSVGLLIATVASACYVASWMLIYYRVAPDFVEKLGAHTIEQERASGASEAEIAATTAQWEKYQELYKNPLINAGVTFMEPFWVGVIVSLVSAGILRRRRPDGVGAPAGRSTPVPT
jgi:hypothetical protein